MKTKLIILLIFFHVSLLAQNYRDSVSNFYTSQIGVMELTGNNDGLEVESYIESTGLNSKGRFAWCGGFVNKPLYDYDLLRPKYPARAASWVSVDSLIIYEKNDSWDNIIKTDIFTLYYKSLGRVGHVGWIDSIKTDDYIITVEGNTNDAGSREGDGVFKKRRLKRHIYKIARWIPEPITDLQIIDIDSINDLQIIDIDSINDLFYKPNYGYYLDSIFYLKKYYENN